MIYSQAFFLVALFGTAANAHICMWAPNQRGGANVNTPGESVCYLKEGPCGGVASAEPTTTLVGGKPFTIMFQQNLNHYYLDNPGSLEADFANVADPTEEDFTALGSVADYNALNEITQTNFTLRVKIPNVASDHAVVRLRYISQNPTENDRGTTFYQCADVKITKSSEAELATEEAAAAVTSAAARGPGGTECCTAKQFTMDGYETHSWRNPTSKKYYFDADLKLFRQDTNSGKGTTAKDGHFQMISNFTSGIEYYYNVNDNSCGLYGLNYWSDWCYGAYNGQSFEKSVHVAGGLADVWSKKDTPFTWTNAQGTCAPVSNARTDTKETTMFSNYQAVQPDAAVWTIPAACVRAEAAITATERAALKPREAKDSSAHKVF